MSLNPKTDSVNRSVENVHDVEVVEPAPIDQEDDDANATDEPSSFDRDYIEDRIPMRLIDIDSATQLRPLNPETVAEYAASMEADTAFPPVTIFYDGQRYWLADGHHRHAAALQAGVKKISAIIKNGSQRDAILAACGANAAHGLRRSNADKRRVVAVLLADAEWQAWSDRQIAEQCGVSHNFVSELRRQLSSHDSCQDYEKRIGRDGRVRSLPKARPTAEPVEREPGDDTESEAAAEAANKAKRRMNGKEKVSAKDRRAATMLISKLVKMTYKLGIHNSCLAALDHICAEINHA